MAGWSQVLEQPGITRSMWNKRHDRNKGQCGMKPAAKESEPGQGASDSDVRPESHHTRAPKDPAKRQRQYCRKCGGHLLTAHAPLGLVDVFAATIPSLTFTPGVHVNYAETVLPMRDGLPKLKDFPAEFGGSGEAMAE